MKKTTSILLTVLLLLTVINFGPVTVQTAYAQSFTTPDGIVFDKDTNTITWYTGTHASLDIPASIDGVSVLHIGCGAFSNSTLQSVTIPYGVQTIGQTAFYCCTSLQSVQIPQSVESIGENSFSNCSNLQSITIPSLVSTIPANTFAGCTSLQNVTIGSSVETISSNAFENCASLQSIAFPTSVKTIGSFAFAHSGLQSLNIPYSVLEIEEQAFSNSSNLQSLSIAGSVDTIGMNAFANCNNLSSLELSYGIKTIGAMAFDGCSSLENITIPNSVEVIEDLAFHHCYNLDSLTIGNSVKTIGRSAFSGCNNLISLNLSNSVQIIGPEAFSGCMSLETIDIPDSVKEIGGKAFMDCDSLRELNLGNSVESIGNAAFNPTPRSLKHVIIPDSVKHIGDFAFNPGFDPLWYDQFIIYGSEAAEEYARAHKLIFVPSEYAPTGSLLKSDATTFLVIDSWSRQTVPCAVVDIIGVDEYINEESDTEEIKTYYSTFSNKYGVARIDANNILNAGHFRLEFDCMPSGYDYQYRVGSFYNNQLIYYYVWTEDDNTQPEEPDPSKKPTIQSFTRVNTNENLLHQIGEYYYDSKGERNPETFRMDAEFPNSLRSSYEIIQDGQVIKSSVDGFFSIDMTKDFQPNKKVYVRAVNQDGVYSDVIETKVYIYDEINDPIDNFELPLASNTEVAIPDDLDILAGQSLSFGLENNVEFGVEYALDGSVKVYVKDNSMNAEPDSYQKQKEYIDKALSNKNYLNSEELKKYQKKVSGGFKSLDVIVLGCGSGVIVDGNLKVDLIIFIGVKASYQHTWTRLVFTPAGVPIPLYLQASADLDWQSKFTSFSISIGVDGFQVRAGDILFNPILSMTIGAGVGIPKIVTLGGEATGTFDYSASIKTGHQRLKLMLRGALVFTIGDFVRYELFNLSLDEPIELYDSTKAQTQQSAGLNVLEKAYNSSTYELITRREAASTLNAYSSETTLIEANVYQNASPKIVSVNGTPYIFYLKDDLVRANQDKVMLVYSKYENGQWSSPVAIQNDGTSDSYFDICVDNDDIHIVWHDSKTQFAEDVTLDQYVQSSEVSYAVLNTLTQEITTTRLTDNDTMDTFPRISIKEGVGSIVWLSNSDDNILMNSGTNTVNQVNVNNDGTGSITQPLSTAKIIKNCDIGYLNDALTTAYVLDEDASYDTPDDTELYIQIGSTEQRLTDNSVIESNPVFENINGVDRLIWFSGGSLKSTTNPSIAPDDVLPDGMMNSDRFSIISHPTDSMVIWNDKTMQNDEINTVTYDHYLDGRYPTPSAAKVSSNPYHLPTGYIDGQDIFLAYVNETDTEIDLVCESGIQGSKTDLAIESISYAHSDVVPGQPLTLNAAIANIGNEEIDAIDVQILRGNEVVYSQTVEQQLMATESTTITISDFDVPSDISLEDDYQIVCNVEGDAAPSDNKKAFKLGYSDLLLDVRKYHENGEYYAEISVTNNTAFATDGKLLVKECSQNASLLEETDFTNITKGDTKLYTLNLSPQALRTNCEMIEVEIVCGENDGAGYNNAEVLTVPGNIMVGSSLVIDVAKQKCSTISNNDGSIQLMAYNGSGNYLYSIDHCETWQDYGDFNYLADGVYDIYVLDADDYTKTQIVTVYNTITDLNNDDIIDMLDLVELSKEYNTLNVSKDLDCNGIINLFDLVKLAMLIE